MEVIRRRCRSNLIEGREVRCAAGRGVAALLLGREISLRPLTAEDVTMIEEWNRDEETKELAGWDSKGHLSHSEWYGKMIAGRNCKILGIWTRDGKMIGDIGLSEISWRSGEAELAVRIGEKEYWNRGYGRDAVETLVRHAFVDLGLRRIYLRVYSDNARAIRCYESCGFVKEGVVKRRLDSSVKTIYLMSVTPQMLKMGRARKRKAS